ncbi:MAG TPA: inorganic diphosphatase [Armatimonadetes bacterium]|jgi:inorganic pyrophosphatase|nr:inorganic diphosphatase [Armatimonadota bacterium]
MGLQDVSIGDAAPHEVNAIVEMPKGSSNKYEYDPERDVFVLDRALYSALFAPADYGYVAQTLAEDGDALDILVVTTFPAFPGCVVAARPVGVLLMCDEKGKDEKILAVSARDPRFNAIDALEDVPDHLLREITHYFRTYKELEDKATQVLDWHGRDRALTFIEECHARFLAGKERVPTGEACVFAEPGYPAEATS